MKQILIAVITIAAISILVPPFLLAAGGKNQWNNPIFAEDQCVATLPPGIDLDTCTTIQNESGLIQYYCQNVPVFILCPDDGPQAPGQNK